MSNVGYATLSIIPSARGFGRALGSQVDPQMTSTGTSAGQRSGNAFAGAFKSLVGPALALVSTAAIGSFVKGAISQAGDLEQSVGAIETVFKGSSGQMLKWADQAATSVGLTKNEFNELGTLIGTQLKNGGTAMEDLAPKTNDLITLGSDLSSMFGGTTADAVGALSSALKGERDPIERFGVSLNQAKIDAEAAALGFEKVGGSLSTEANQAATLSLIMKQTADAHGNFARETETLSHQQQVMGAQFKDIQTQIGGFFLPILTQLFSFINTSILPGIGKFTAALGSGGLGGMFPELGSAITAFGAAWEANDGDVTSSGLPGFFEVLANSIRPVFDAFSNIAPTVGGLVTTLSPLGLLFRSLAPVLPQIATTLGQLGEAIGGILTLALAQLTPILEQFVTYLSGIFMAVMPAVSAMIILLGNAFTTLAPVIMGVISAIMPLVFSLMSELIPIITSLVSSIMPPLVSIFGNVINAIAPLITMISGLLIPIIAALLPVVTTVFQAVASIITAAMKIVQGIIQVVSGIIQGNWSMVWTGIKNIFSGVWDGIKAILTGAVNVIRALIVAALGVIRAVWDSAWSFMKSLVSSAWSGITSAVSSGVNSVMSWVRGLPGQISGALSGLGSLLTGAGQAIMDGLLGGLKAAWSKVTDFVGGIAGWIADHKGPLPYDRRLLIPAGKAIMDGLGKGLRGELGALKSTLQVVTDTIVDGVSGGIAGGAGAITDAVAGLTPVVPAVQVPDVQGGGLQGALTAYSAQTAANPLIGNLTLQGSGNVREDVEEAMFHVRRIARGGLYA